jgi:hypothetical protein
LVVTAIRRFAPLLIVIGGVALAEPPSPARVDPLQQAVVDSLAFPQRTTPPALLEAVVRAADVEAWDVSAAYLARLVGAIDAAGDGRLELLADLGATFDAGRLARLERVMRGHAPEVTRVVAAIRAADAVRRRDPDRLARAASDLRGDDPTARAAAAQRLSAAGLDALPTLVDVLRDPAATSAHQQARRLIQDLGPAAREPLLAWLASADLERWDGVIAALEASGADDVGDFLLAPALVAGTPPAVRAAALRALARLGTAAPERTQAIERLARRLGGVLSREGLPPIDHLLLEPPGQPAAQEPAGSPGGTVERIVWNGEARRAERRSLSPRLARALDLEHLARDIVALSPDNPAVIELVLLARLETALAISAPNGSGARPGPARVRSVLAGPDGFDVERTVAIMEAAIERGLWEAAAAAASALEPPDRGAVDDRVALPPDVRKALVRALALPDADVQFAAARTLARAAGDAPYPGSSLVVKTLVHAANGSGEDRVVIAHPDRAVAEELATGISRFGYSPVVVRTGREAVFASRGSPDTVLVLLAARSIAPGALETVQYLRQPGLGAPPPVLVIVDPLDDDGRGRYLQKQLLAFADLDGVVLIDRLGSLFEAPIDEETGTPSGVPRFPDILTQFAGPAAVDPAARAAARETRLARARDALSLLADLGRRGHDVSGATDAALRGIRRPDLAVPAAATLGGVGQPVAQYALFREATRSPPPAGEAALTALRLHVARHGMLLDAGTIDEACARYTDGTVEAERSAVGAALAALGIQRGNEVPPAVDAAPARSTR